MSDVDKPSTLGCGMDESTAAATDDWKAIRRENLQRRAAASNDYPGECLWDENRRPSPVFEKKDAAAIAFGTSWSTRTEKEWCVEVNHNSSTGNLFAASRVANRMADQLEPNELQCISETQDGRVDAVLDEGSSPSDLGLIPDTPEAILASSMIDAGVNRRRLFQRSFLTLSATNPLSTQNKIRKPSLAINKRKAKSLDYRLKQLEDKISPLKASSAVEISDCLDPPQPPSTNHILPIAENIFIGDVDKIICEPNSMSCDELSPSILSSKKAITEKRVLSSAAIIKRPSTEAFPESKRCDIKKTPDRNKKLSDCIPAAADIPLQAIHNVQSLFGGKAQISQSSSEKLRFLSKDKSARWIPETGFLELEDDDNLQDILGELKTVIQNSSGGSAIKGGPKKRNSVLKRADSSQICSKIKALDLLRGCNVNAESNISVDPDAELDTVLKVVKEPSKISAVGCLSSVDSGFASSQEDDSQLTQTDLQEIQEDMSTIQEPNDDTNLNHGCGQVIDVAKLIPIHTEVGVPQIKQHISSKLFQSTATISAAIDVTPRLDVDCRVQQCHLLESSLETDFKNMSPFKIDRFNEYVC